MPLSRSDRTMTRSVVDSALMLQAIAGYDAADVKSYDMPVPDLAGGLRRSRNVRIRIGVARNYFNESLDPEIKEAVDDAVSLFVKLGAEIHEVRVPISPARTVIQAEAFAYHAASIAKMPELYLPDTLGKLRLGAAIDMDTYVTARLGLDQLRRNAPALFRQIDVLLTPTTPCRRRRPARYRRRSTTSWRTTACCGATRGRSIFWHSPRSQFRAGSPARACRLGCS